MPGRPPAAEAAAAQEEAARALGYLARDEDGRIEIADLGGIVALVQLVQDDDRDMQLAAPWQKKVAEVSQLALDVAAGRRLAGSIYARSALAKGAFASKIYHTFTVQAPFEGARTAALAKLQRVLNRLVFGGFHPVSLHTAQQAPGDAGVGHINIARRLRAEGARLAAQRAAIQVAVTQAAGAGEVAASVEQRERTGEASGSRRRKKRRLKS